MRNFSSMERNGPGMLRAVIALLLVLLLMFPVLFGTDLLLSTVPAEARTFRGTMDHVAVFEEDVPDTNALLWTFSAQDQVQSTPVPYGDKVYFGSDDGNIYAVDAMWGTEAWSFGTGASVMASPTFSDDGVLYIGSANQVFYALDPETGDEFWHFQVPSRFGQIVSSAAIDDHRAYFGASDRNVYAVNLTTHEEDWNFSTDNEVWASPALWGDHVYVGSLDGQMYCLWRENGTLVWNFSTAGWEGIYSSPAVADGKVVFGTAMDDDAVYALDALTGDVVWRFQAPGPNYASPAIHDGTVLIPTWGSPGRLYALPLVDPSPGDGVLVEGDIIWSAVIDDEQGGSSPLYSDGRVLVGSDFRMGDDGRLFCFDATDGKEIWNLTTGGDVYSSPSVKDGVVFIGSNDGRVYAVGGDGEAKMEVLVLPEVDRVQGGRVIGVSFLVTYRGMPLEGAFVKVRVSEGELSQSGASTFPDGTQRVKYQAPKVDTNTVIRFDAEATFFGVDPALGSANITVEPASMYKVDSSGSFPIMKYILYIGLISFLVIANVALVVLARRKDKVGGEAG